MIARARSSRRSNSSAPNLVMNASRLSTAPVKCGASGCGRVTEFLEKPRRRVDDDGFGARRDAAPRREPSLVAAFLERGRRRDVAQTAVGVSDDQRYRKGGPFSQA